MLGFRAILNGWDWNWPKMEGIKQVRRVISCVYTLFGTCPLFVAFLFELVVLHDPDRMTCVWLLGKGSVWNTALLHRISMVPCKDAIRTPHSVEKSTAGTHFPWQPSGNPRSHGSFCIRSDTASQQQHLAPEFPQVQGQSSTPKCKPKGAVENRQLMLLFISSLYSRISQGFWKSTFILDIASTLCIQLNSGWIVRCILESSVPGGWYGMK